MARERSRPPKQQGTRIERDSLGEMRVPADALYGASAARAVENFSISGLRFPRSFIRALGLIKACAAEVNAELELLEPELAEAIAGAARKVASGECDGQFVVDVFQTGSGTSTNMNANEVIANLASLSIGGRAGERARVHPNDHVNLGQSSNDVFPSALHVAALGSVEEDLVPALAALRDTLQEKSREFDDVLKTGRTHLQDAVPITLGQEFSGYARQIELCRERVKHAGEGLQELPLGGTAVGTGLNAHSEFGTRMAAALSRETGLRLREAENHFEAQAARDAAVLMSGALRVLAVALHKIAGDIRWLGSGPRAGLGEIELPAVQPGSSIMPGKVNPVLPEAVIQVAAQVVGNDAAITLGGIGGRFELNLMMPLIAHNLLQSISLLSRAATLFRERCVEGIAVHRERCQSLVERNLALATALAPEIGYDRAAEIAKKAFASGRTIREVALEDSGIAEKRLDALLDPSRMARPSRA